jgi:hypothetical protein
MEEIDPKDSRKLRHIDRISKISETVRDGVLEKWLNYTKSENLN